MDGMLSTIFKIKELVLMIVFRKVACVLSELNIPYRTVFVDFSKVALKIPLIRELDVDVTGRSQKPRLSKDMSKRKGTYLHMFALY